MDSPATCFCSRYLTTILVNHHSTCTMGRTLMASYPTPCTHWRSPACHHPATHHPFCQRRNGTSHWIWSVCMDYPRVPRPLDQRRLCTCTDYGYVQWTSRGIRNLHHMQLLFAIHSTLPIDDPTATNNTRFLRQRRCDHTDHQPQFRTPTMGNPPGQLSNIRWNPPPRAATTTIPLWLSPRQRTPGSDERSSTVHPRTVKHRLWQMRIPITPTSKWSWIAISS